MDIELLPENIKRLESAFNNILYMKEEDRLINLSITQIQDVKDAINNIFTNNKCVDVLYTMNTDKQFFGIRISPIITPAMPIEVIIDEVSTPYTDNIAKTTNIIIKYLIIFLSEEIIVFFFLSAYLVLLIFFINALIIL